MPPRKRTGQPSRTGRQRRSKRVRISEVIATHPLVPQPAINNSGLVSLDVNALSATISTAISEAVKTALSKGLIALEDNPFFQVSKKIKICHCGQKPGATAFFVATKMCLAPNKVQRGRRLPLKQAKLIQISGRFHSQFVLKILKTIS